MGKIRLTETVRSMILSKNEGFKRRTSYESRNHSYEREYVIKAGKLMIRETGETSWADSKYDKEYEADKDQLLYFLRNYLNDLKID